MAVVFQGIEGEKKGRMVIGCASVLRLGHGNTKTLLSFFPNNIGAKHFLRAKTLNSSNLTPGPLQDLVLPWDLDASSQSSVCFFNVHLG